MFQEQYQLSSQLRQSAEILQRFPEDQNQVKLRKKSSKKKKRNVQKLRMEQLSTVYSFSVYTQPKSPARNVNRQSNQLITSPKTGSHSPHFKRKLNNLTLLQQQRPMQIKDFHTDGLQNLYNTQESIKITDIFQQQGCRSKSTKNFKIPQCIRPQIELNKLRISLERQTDQEQKQNQTQINKKKKQYTLIQSRHIQLRNNGNLSAIPSQTPSTASDVQQQQQHQQQQKQQEEEEEEEHEEQGIEQQQQQQELSPQSLQYREISYSLDVQKLHTTNSQHIESIRNQSYTQPLKNITFNKHRSLSLNQNNSNKSQANPHSQHNFQNEEEFQFNQSERKNSDSISGYFYKKNKWEEEFIGLVNDDNDLYRTPFYTDSQLRQSIYKKDERCGSKTSKFSSETISFSNSENIERLKKKLTFQPREFIPLGTKYSFQSDNENSNYFKAPSSTSRVENYKTRLFNEGIRDPSPNLQKKISKRFFDRYQQNPLTGVNQNQTLNNASIHEIDLEKVKQKTGEIKKSTKQLSFFPWRLNQIMKEKELSEKQKNPFEFESNNLSHKQPPLKQQQDLESRFKTLMQKMNVKKQLEELNQMINKSKQISAHPKDSDQVPKIVRFLNQNETEL